MIEPPCPAGRKPHSQRVREIAKILPEGKTASICIDDTPEHRAYYLHELAKYPRLTVIYQGPLIEGAERWGVYVIKVAKVIPAQ